VVGFDIPEELGWSGESTGSIGEEGDRMKYLVLLVIGVALGAGGYWFFTQPDSAAKLAEASESAKNKATEMGKDLRETLSAPEFKEELERTGKVIREKAKQAGAALADATANARLTAAVKAKLVQDAGLAGLKIDVDVTDGAVTLSGTVASHEANVRAVDLALQTEGVHKVTSTIQVKEPAP